MNIAETTMYYARSLVPDGLLRSSNFLRGVPSPGAPEVKQLREEPRPQWAPKIKQFSERSPVSRGSRGVR
ncbi:hypothetical protein SNEBB_006707 [Seison nebaliae]|nr:hypothetical protein SNEBB_006707 [Seison nebaliae]